MVNLDTYDVVVVGAGIAGSSAALSAAERGLRTLLLEKMDAPGGSSAMSGGYFAFLGTDEQAEQSAGDSEELFFKDMVEGGGGVADEALLRAYLAHQADTYRWIKSLDPVFRTLELSSGQSAPRSHSFDIVDLLAKLRARFAELGGELRTGTPVASLRTEGEAVTGVVLASGEEVAAGAVILAAGGFSRGQDLLRTFAPAALGAIPYGGLGSTGDGLKMAWRLGAGLADMAFVEPTYGSHPETGIEFHELLTAYYLGAIIVNRAGQRFVDESQSYKVLGREVLEQEDALGFEIFDAKVRAKSMPVPLKDMDLLESIGHLHRADSLEELAAVAGIDADALVATVARYNEAIASGDRDEQGREALCNGVGDLLPIDEAPYYAYPAQPLMTTTYCGVTVTPDARVKRVDGSIIEGLYAVGEMVGGFHGAEYQTGTSLGKGAVFGRVAAHHVADAKEAAR